MSVKHKGILKLTPPIQSGLVLNAVLQAAVDCVSGCMCLTGQPAHRCLSCGATKLELGMVEWQGSGGNERLALGTPWMSLV